MVAAKTQFRVVKVVISGPPRWGMAHRWIVQDGPPGYREVAGPFTSRRKALEALGELVNAAHSGSVV